jgi:hypothetical protein
MIGMMAALPVLLSISRAVGERRAKRPFASLSSLISSQREDREWHDAPLAAVEIGFCVAVIEPLRFN